MPRAGSDRRDFLVAGSTAAIAGSVASAADRPAVSNPRATSGDVAAEPNWTERLTLDIGNSQGTIVGSDDRAIQAAVDYVARLGGGTVRLSKGTWRLRNAVFLSSGVRLLGAGPETVLVKDSMSKTRLVADSDWFDQEITLADPSGFRVGDGVCLRCRNPHNGGATVIKRTLVARSGNRFKLDKPLRENLWLMSDATAATLFPLVTAEFAHGMAIENLTLDGNRANNDNLDGNYAGCVFMQDCRDVSIRGVVARDNNGDGISWQICHDVSVADCQSVGHAGLGLHPGSGSQRPVIRGNTLARNDIGLFFCWGVRHGLAEGNTIEDNRVGVSIGHRDTENLVAENTIRRSGKCGVLFRAERGKAFAGHRNELRGNSIIDSGGVDGVAVNVEGQTSDLRFIGNTLRETRAPASRVGFRFAAGTGTMTLADNKVTGFSREVVDQRPR
jgi:hypothetical protein